MEKLKLYLDNCCFNRPFDDQSYLTVFLETQAVDFILNGIEQGDFELIWSFVLDDENDQNLDYQKCETVKIWKFHAVADVDPHADILHLAKKYEEHGIKAMDALHVACAVHSQADYFVTTDSKLLKKSVQEISMVNPLDFVRMVER